MPKAAIKKHRHTLFCENEIGPADEICVPSPTAYATLAQQLDERDLGRGVAP